MSACEYCGAPFEGRRVRPRRFCSQACNGKAHMAPPKPCAVDDCATTARGTSLYCDLHRQRLRKHGDVSQGRWPDKLTRVLSRIRNDGCWVWTGSVFTTTGYGQVWADGTNHPAHRVVYELLMGPIPAGLQLDHLCRNRACVNPLHLEPVTAQVNIQRGWAARKGATA